MSCYYSEQTGSFYDESIHGVFGEPESTIPNDAREVSQEEIQMLIDGQYNGKLIKFNAELKKPVLVDAPAKTEEQLKAELLRLLIQVCDQKQNDAIKLLIGYKATPGQLERYKRKYERALAGAFSAEENAAIIAAHEGFLNSIDNFADMIEYARIHTAGLIDTGELVKAEAIIEQAKAFDSTTTMEQVQSLFV